jgi:hypothetical protein
MAEAADHGNGAEKPSQAGQPDSATEPELVKFSPEEELVC